MGNSFHSIRRQYIKGAFSETQVHQDPLVQLEYWLTDAIRSECPEPTAMVLSTTGQDFRPSSRVVLLKGIGKIGVTFFTNYNSRKGHQLLENPQASLLFFWPGLERQVRLEGAVTKVTAEESDTYFDTRPESSRISAIISPQSQVIPNREWLHDKIDLLRNPTLQSGNSFPSLTRPVNWGGYRMMPEYLEFWQGREDRLHDRIVFRKAGAGWTVFRLAP